MIMLILKPKYWILTDVLPQFCVGFYDCSSLESVFKASTHIHEIVYLLLGR